MLASVLPISSLFLFFSHSKLAQNTTNASRHHTNQTTTRDQGMHACNTTAVTYLIKVSARFLAPSSFTKQTTLLTNKLMDKL